MDRFNLVVPASLVERNFNVDTALQRGLSITFRLTNHASRGPQHVLEPVHGYISRHVNPIGLTSYRVSGQQPSGAVSGCSLLGWSAQEGRLVVDLAAPASQPKTPVKEDAPAVRRLFADCLPSPTTVRKVSQPEAPRQQQPQAHRLEAPRTEAPPPPQGPESEALPQPHGQQLQQPQQQQQPVQPRLSAWLTSSHTLTHLDVAASDSAGQPAGSSGTSPLCRFDSDLPEDSGCEQESQPFAIGRAQRSCSSPNARPTCSAGAAWGADNIEAPAKAERPKRLRRCHSVYSNDSDPEPPNLHEGIDLLLAAHATLMTADQGARPKRARQPKVIFEPY